jgi:hypothetical protein
MNATSLTTITEFYKEIIDARSYNNVRRATADHSNKEQPLIEFFNGYPVTGTGNHVSKNADNHMDLNVLYMMIIIFAIIGFLSAHRRAKTHIWRKIATATVRTHFVQEGAGAITSEEERPSFRRQATRLTSTQELIYVTKSWSEVYRTRDCRFMTRFSPSMKHNRICSECYRINTREYNNEDLHSTAAHNATTTNGTHMFTSRGDHIPINTNINSNFEIWCLFKAFDHQHIMYSTPLGENGDHFLRSKICLPHMRIVYDILKTTTAHNKEAGIISPTTFLSGTTTPHLGPAVAIMNTMGEMVLMMNLKPKLLHNRILESLVSKSNRFSQNRPVGPTVRAICARDCDSEFL